MTVRGGFADKVALVTGGGSGIGRASAIALAQAGAAVAVVDTDDQGAAGSVDAIQGDGGQALAVHCDVAFDAETRGAVARVVERFGRLDCAINNAGIQGDLSPTAECSVANWNRTLAVNLTGVWHCMRHEIPALLAAGGGAIVNVASNFGLVGSVGMPAYSASKHGVVGLTKTAALEYARAGIRVNALCPGPVQTPMVDKILRAKPEHAQGIIDAIVEREPVGRFGTPEEIADAALWLCSDGASFVTGAVLAADGGFVAQ